MKILITGGSGFLGSGVVRKFLSAGYSIRVLLLPQDPAPALHGLTIERSFGNVLDPKSLIPALQGCQGVIHAAGPTHLGPHKKTLLHQIHVEGTRNVCLAAKAAGVKRLVHISSACTLGATPHAQPLSESVTGTFKQIHKSYYMSAKLKAETLALSQSSPDFEVIAALPTMLWGPGDFYSSSTSIGRQGLTKKWMRYTVKSGASILDIEDAAEGVRLAFEKGRAGERYLLGGDNVSLQELYTEVCNNVDPNLKPRPVSLSMLTLLGLTAEFLNLLGIHIGFSMDIRWYTGVYFWTDDQKARTELGFTRSYTWQQSIRRTLAWLRTNPVQWKRYQGLL